jgi:uncharacterized protein YgbK (DUF1537 family)
MLLGCIADDFTGATDLANTLTRQGMPTAVMLGAPRAHAPAPGADAVVIALKSRSIPAGEAVGLSLASLDWLRTAGPPAQYYFKYCSTFDSTDAGNIGPVADALLAALNEQFTVACPAYPTNQRTVYKGHLFVGDALLSDSSMRDHPLTPMTDPSLVRVLARQTKGRVGLVQHEMVARGPEAIRAALHEMRAHGYRYAIVDALSDADLTAIGTACADMKLLTGGSGLALGLPDNFRRAGRLREGQSDALPEVGGHAAVLAGSCSAATRRQVAVMQRHCQCLELNPFEIGEGADVARNALEWSAPRLSEKPVLIYSTAEPVKVREVQAALGREQAGQAIERTFGMIAKGLVELGVRRLVVAGGETAGAVVNALGIEGLQVGPEIDPGVPWTVSIGEPPIALALKSGNFGADDFFPKAFKVME